MFACYSHACPLANLLNWVLGLFKSSEMILSRFFSLCVCVAECLCLVVCFTLHLSEAADSNVAGDDGFDDKGCHCEISVEDLLPSVKSVIRAVR